jgi:hypothetical protein
LSHTHFPHEHTAIGNHRDQIAFFQTPARFPYRSSADAEHLGQRALVNAISYLQFSPNDHPLEFFRNQGSETFGAPAL